MARLDASQEIIDNDLVSDGLGLMEVLASDAYVEINGEATLASDFGPFDPIAEGVTDGTYLVGTDIQPGEYRVRPVDGTSYWARLAEGSEIIDNGLSEGQLIVVIQPDDWAFTFTGTLESTG